MDSILQNVRGQYISLFARYAVDMCCRTYEHVRMSSADISSAADKAANIPCFLFVETASLLRTDVSCAYCVCDVHPSPPSPYVNNIPYNREV